MCVPILRVIKHGLIIHEGPYAKSPILRVIINDCPYAWCQ
jgi:hypothetical protein